MFLLHLSAAALACGGFFCQREDIDQAAENIVFAQTQGEMTVHVQIAYEGSTDDFSWVVPVPQQPTLFLSHEELFRQVELNLSPVFQTIWTDDGHCDWPLYAPEAEVDFAGGTDTADFDNGVTIVETGTVGPYATVILQADSTGALLTWLEANNYDVPSTYDQVVAPYVASRAYFVALRLRAGKDTGDLRPLGMRYVGDTPMIPLVLTSIAATPDMRLRANVFGAHRAVPENYLHVQINPRAIDWPNNGANYDDVVTRAANEAGGRAFATDMADKVSQTGLPGTLWSPRRFDTASLKTLTDPVAFLDAVQSQPFPRDDTLLSVLSDILPMPQSLEDQGVTPQDYYNCLACYPETASMVFDPVSAADILQSDIVEPLKDAESLFDLPWVSRLTSSMSPNEMTMDPHFVFNADMGKVDRVRTATIDLQCLSSLGDPGQAPAILTLENGTAWYVPSLDTDVYGDFMANAPAASVIEETASSGQPHTLWEYEPPQSEAGPTEDPKAGGGCGCASTPGPLSLLSLAALGLLPLVRRRS